MGDNKNVRRRVITPTSDSHTADPLLDQAHAYDEVYAHLYEDDVCEVVQRVKMLSTSEYNFYTTYITINR